MPHSYKALKDDGQTMPMLSTKVVYTDPHVQPLPSRTPSPDPSMSFRELARTPSPTPSELEALHPVPFDPRSILTKEFWFSKEMISMYLYDVSISPNLTPVDSVRSIIIIVSVGFALMFTVFRTQIANWLQPAANSIHKWVDECLMYAWRLIHSRQVACRMAHSYCDYDHPVVSPGPFRSSLHSCETLLICFTRLSALWTRNHRYYVRSRMGPLGWVCDHRCRHAFGRTH